MASERPEAWTGRVSRASESGYYKESMPYDTVTAFFDDSGGPDPNSSRSFCFGAVVLPASLVRESSDAWTQLVGRHFDVDGDQLGYYGCEVKSSDLYDLRRKLRQGPGLRESQKALFAHGLNSLRRADALIEDIWEFLARPSVPLKYIAACVKKDSAWTKFRREQFARWQSMQTVPRAERVGEKPLRAELSNFILSHAFEYLLQRIDYLGGDDDFQYHDALVIGDQSAVTRLMHESQAGIQAGRGYFTDLPRLVNNVWFGSSRFSPQLQMADWIAYAVRTWAEGKREGFDRLRQVQHLFRGYPSRVDGYGVVLAPDSEGFPELPPPQIARDQASRYE